MTCPIDHEAIKRDAAAWDALHHIGDQIIEADSTGPAERLELRNCSCGTTLAKRIATPSLPHR